jgi:DNA-binding NtrC family response regulator
MKILVVDDEEEIVEEIGTFLHRRGHGVVGAGGIAAALNALDTEGPFDVVLTDMRMEDGTGLDVLRACRTCAPQPSALVMSGHASTEDVVQARHDGAVHFLSKPVAIRELARALAEIAADRDNAPGDSQSAAIADLPQTKLH